MKISDIEHTQIIKNSKPNKFMMDSLDKFIDTIVFNEKYVKLVKAYQDHKKQYTLNNLLKEIRNGKK